MGKRPRQESLKASNKEKKEQQLHNLIKVLRPKVYITDSSSFKSLVQDLTGNGSTILSSPSPSIASPPPQTDAIFRSCLGHDSSRDVSLDVSNDSTEMSNFQASLTHEEEPTPWQYDSSLYNDDITSNCSLQVDEEIGLTGCEDLESLLLDMDEYNWCGNYSQMFNDEKVGGCDYDLSELLY